MAISAFSSSRANGRPTPPPYTILIMNGPNLGHLGERQPEIYGSQGLDLIPAMVQQLLGERAAEVELSFFQSNSEGRLIDRLEQANVKGKKVAVFGCGESDRTWFCGAVDAIEKKLKELDAHVVDTLRVDGDPKEKRSVINDWANRVGADMIKMRH